MKTNLIAIGLVLSAVVACTTLPENLSPSPNPPSASATTTSRVEPVVTLPPSPIFTSSPTLTPVPTFTSPPPIVSTQTSSGISSEVTPGSVSGPYAVILVSSDGALNIRSAPGENNSILGTLAYNENQISRTGSSAKAGDTIWWEIRSPDATLCWVNASYLTEVIAPQTFCADDRVTSLLQNFEDAIDGSNGVLLASLVSPKHGMDIWLGTSNSKPINFDAEHARWVFDSTYVHNWGSIGASGIDTKGSFKESVLPELLYAFVPSARHLCNDPNISSYAYTWPSSYANVNFYQVFRPGTPGNELDWSAWLAGVEYVNGNPYLFAFIHYMWEP